MDDRSPDPFAVLSLPYSATPDDVRRAFRQRARETHPDRGGSADAFLRVRQAHDALVTDLDGARRQWGVPDVPRAPASRFAGGIDPREFPTYPVRITRSRQGARRLQFPTEAAPAGWKPGSAPPPGGACRARFAATGTSAAFGVWVVPLGGDTFRCVYGPDSG